MNSKFMHSSADQSQSLLLLDGAMGNRSEDVRIKAGIAFQVLRIDLIALTVAVRDRPQLAHVRHNNLVAKLLKLLADPNRVNAGLHRNASVRYVNGPLIDGLRRRPEAASIDHTTFPVEGASPRSMPIVSSALPRFLDNFRD
jgi:hypothetical protein